MIALSTLPRLRALLVDDAGQATYELALRRDGDGRRLVEGAVRASLRVTCQRCLEPYDLPVEERFHLVLLEQHEGADDLPEGFDPLWLEQRMIRPKELIEDELILAVPAIPRHAPGECRAPGGADELVQAIDEQREHPFAALAAWKPNTND